LFIPILQQKIIDEYVLARYISVQTDISMYSNLSPEGLSVYKELLSAKNSKQIRDKVYILRNRDLVISTKAETELKGKGILDDASWYVFSFKPTEAIYEIIIRHADLFEYNYYVY